MNWLQLLREAGRLLWRFHFHIPESVFWVVLLLSGMGLVLEASEAALVFGLPFLAALIGILRWRFHRRRGRLALVVPHFATLRGQEGRARYVQEVIVTSLQDKLPPAELALVHSVPAVVGTHDRGFAVRLRRRLRAQFLLHGRIEERPDGSYGVFARVVQPSDRSVTHMDWHTRDVTPAKASWGALFELLTPAKNVAAEEYPLEFTTELESIVRGTAGQIALMFEDYSRAEELLRAAIARAPNSTSHQVDQLRSALSRAIFRQGRKDEALSILRARAAGDNPSPHLLRTLFELLAPQRGTREFMWSTEDRAEAIAALRRAGEYEADLNAISLSTTFRNCWRDKVKRPTTRPRRSRWNCCSRALTTVELGI
jgi:hypothetical protein